MVIVLEKVNDLKVLNQIIDIFVELFEKITEVKCKTSKSDYLNNIHNIVTVDNLNDVRMKIINGINQHLQFREYYFNLAKPLLETMLEMS